MTSVALLALHRKGSERKAAPVAQALAQYPLAFRPRIEALAARHPHLADLALSHPALLAALAGDGNVARREAVIAAVIDGASLKHVSVLAGVPFWTRKLPPNAFEGPLPPLPDDLLFAWRIGSHLPADPAKAARWLTLIAHVYAVADSAVALWFAKVLAKETGIGSFRQVTLIGMWAWATQRPETPIGQCVGPRWHSGIGLKAALKAAQDWEETVNLALELSGRPIGDLWHPPGPFEGLDFLPLATPSELTEEARAMNHCVRTYADTLLINECRLWSLRREGKRIATLEVRNQEHGLACIGQLRGLSNAPVDRDIWWIASRWLLRVDLRQIAPLPADSWDNIPGADAAFARRFWAAYWLDKGRFPEWLPYAHARLGPYNPLDARRHDDARFPHRRRRLRRAKALPDIW